MIRSFKSRPLKRFFERNDERRLDPRDVGRIRRILTELDAATQPDDLDLPGLHFHALKHDRAGQFAVTVRAQWRITFEWEQEDAVRVDLEDHHD